MATIENNQSHNKKNKLSMDIESNQSLNSKNKLSVEYDQNGASFIFGKNEPSEYVKSETSEYVKSETSEYIKSEKSGPVFEIVNTTPSKEKKFHLIYYLCDSIYRSYF
ncbi:11823_t:CDS:2 [Racocetra fulgida]|uniref:11823_t:CDS:1 n=1 Tax=Racocetra fulgida TaxID=60492 RepID=A0A9N9C590_9GLOM|nr:11823_t:CDS:2 [Racocetra fulgida]